MGNWAFIHFSLVYIKTQNFSFVWGTYTNFKLSTLACPCGLITVMQQVQLCVREIDDVIELFLSSRCLKPLGNLRVLARPLSYLGAYLRTAVEETNANFVLD